MRCEVLNPIIDALRHDRHNDSRLSPRGVAEVGAALSRRGTHLFGTPRDPLDLPRPIPRTKSAPTRVAMLIPRFTSDHARCPTNGHGCPHLARGCPSIG